jgi:hypothetical protein
MQDWVNAPLTKVLVFVGIVWVAVMFVFGSWLGQRVFDWWDRRQRRRGRLSSWERELAVQRQLRAQEDQLWRERLPDWQREAFEQADRTRAEIRREARRRLGLPAEAGDVDGADETPFDRYETVVEPDETPHPVDAAHDPLDARLAALEAHMNAVNARLALLTHWWVWGTLGLTLEVLADVGLVLWWRTP